MLEPILVVVLIVLVVALFAISYVRKKKFNSNLSEMRNDLKVGDKVMTDSGIVGEVVDSFTEEEYKYFVLKSGKGEHIGYYTVHANAIYYVFGKDEKREEKVTVKVDETKKSTKQAKTEEKKEEIKPEQNKEKEIK